MKRLSWIPLLAVALLAACAPPTMVVNDVRPTLISIQLPEDPQDEIVLVGRYFGDGRDGAADDSYLLAGARSDCSGGVRVQAQTWSSSRITFQDPSGIGSGFVCVVSGGVESNPLPADLN